MRQRPMDASVDSASMREICWDVPEKKPNKSIEGKCSALAAKGRQCDRGLECLLISEAFATPAPGTVPHDRKPASDDRGQNGKSKKGLKSIAKSGCASQYT